MIVQHRHRTKVLDERPLAFNGVARRLVSEGMIRFSIVLGDVRIVFFHYEALRRSGQMVSAGFGESRREPCPNSTATLQLVLLSIVACGTGRPRYSARGNTAEAARMVISRGTRASVIALSSHGTADLASFGPAILRWMGFVVSSGVTWT